MIDVHVWNLKRARPLSLSLKVKSRLKDRQTEIACALCFEAHFSVHIYDTIAYTSLIDKGLIIFTVAVWLLKYIGWHQVKKGRILSDDVPSGDKSSWGDMFAGSFLLHCWQIGSKGFLRQKTRRIMYWRRNTRSRSKRRRRERRKRNEKEEEEKGENGKEEKRGGGEEKHNGIRLKSTF